MWYLWREALSPLQLVSLLIRKLQRKWVLGFTVCYWFTSTRIAKMKKVASSVGRNVEQPKLSYVA